MILYAVTLKNQHITHSTYSGTHFQSGLSWSGGFIYIRGEVEEHQLGSGVAIEEAEESGIESIRPYVEEYVSYFGGSAKDILSAGFMRLSAESHRPFGGLYAY